MGKRNSQRVKLVPFDPGLARRRASIEPDSQCDCACFAMEGEDLPPLESPISFYLELTPHCNNRCPSCGNVFVERAAQAEFNSAKLPLSALEWIRILAKIKPFAHRLKLTGGEPTIHPEFEIIVREIDQMGVPFTLFTNARWREPYTLCQLLQDLEGLDGLLISLHGPERADHEAFTNVVGSFAETIANARLAIAAGFSVSFSCIITRRNWNRIDEMFSMAQQVGADSVVFNRYLGPDVAGLEAAPGELLAAVETISALRASGAPVKLGNCVPECFAATDQAGCLAGLAFFTVDPWGRARPCNHAPLICGDLQEQSVEEIWNSAGMSEWRNFCPEPCQNCPAFSTCRGGCKAQAMSSQLAADPLMDAFAKPPDPRQSGPWTFYEQARPLGHFERYPQQFGALLVRGNRLALISHQLHPVLNALDGQTTLRQIEETHGSAGLELVASLYEQGMIDFVS